jgi:hypothetical protein
MIPSTLNQQPALAALRCGEDLARLSRRSEAKTDQPLTIN